MTAPLPALTEFRLEFPGNGLVHVVFDAPGRTMNVFSEAAIVEIGLIARWLAEADVKGTEQDAQYLLGLIAQLENRTPQAPAMNTPVIQMPSMAGVSSEPAAPQQRFATADAGDLRRELRGNMM